MTALSYHISNLSLIAFEAMRLLVQILKAIDVAKKWKTLKMGY